MHTGSVTAFPANRAAPRVASGTEDGGAQTAIWIPPRSGRSARPPLTCAGMDVVPPASRGPASQKRHAPWPSAPSP